jgi:hypothetical protein
MQSRAQVISGELGVSVEVCWSVLAAESWLIGGIEPQASYCGLDGVGHVPANTETAPAKPKQWLATHLRGLDYGPKTQECLARSVDLQQAKSRNLSLRVFLEKAGQAGVDSRSQDGPFPRAMPRTAPD